MVQTKYYGAEGGPQKSGRNEADAQEGQRFSTQQTQALAQNSTEFQMPGMSFHTHPVRFSGPDLLPRQLSEVVRSRRCPLARKISEWLNGKGAGLLAFIYPPEAIPEGKGRRRNKHRGHPREPLRQSSRQLEGRHLWLTKAPASPIVFRVLSYLRFPRSVRVFRFMSG